MGKYQKLLLIVNRGCQRSGAFRQAVHMAGALGAELHLGLFDHDSSIAAAGLVNSRIMALAKQAYLAEREEWLAELRLELYEQGVNAHTHVIWDAPVHEAIARCALAVGADLVIKDVHFEHGLRRVLFSSLDWKLLMLCPAPLWLVRSGSSGFPKRLVAAVDSTRRNGHGGEVNDEIMRAARRFAEQVGGELDLIHVQRATPPLLLPHQGAGEEVTQLFEVLREQDAQAFQAFAERHAVPFERRHHLTGLVPQAVSQFASERKSELVVLGTTYRTGVERIVLGSMAERILEQIGCDVLAVKPPDFARDVARQIGLGQAA